jgi:hypothetical protein
MQRQQNDMIQAKLAVEQMERMQKDMVQVKGWYLHDA